MSQGNTEKDKEKQGGLGTGPWGTPTARFPGEGGAAWGEGWKLWEQGRVSRREGGASAEGPLQSGITSLGDRLSVG